MGVPQLWAYRDRNKGTAGMSGLQPSAELLWSSRRKLLSHMLTLWHCSISLPAEWKASKRRGCRISKYFLLGGSPALCPNGSEIGHVFDAILYKRSSFPGIPFGMPYFRLFCFQLSKSMPFLMEKDNSPFFWSESCNEAYWYFVPSPEGCPLPVHLPFHDTDIFENSCPLLRQQKNLLPEYCDSYGDRFILTCDPFQIFCAFLAHRFWDHQHFIAFFHWHIR